MSKTCTTCSQIKPMTEFDTNSRSKGGYKNECKDCRRERDRRYYENNKYKTAKRVKNRKNIIRRYIYNYLLKHPCVDCGVTNPIILEFDHIGEKSINVSQIVNYGWSIERINAEISKCQVRCANCHKIKTARDWGWYKDFQ